MFAPLLLALAVTAPPPRPSVVLVTLDTTRADHLGCYGAARAQTPNIDALARAGIRFEQAVSPAPLTLPAHTSLLSGLVPRRHGVRDNSGFPLRTDIPLLTELLRNAGYDTAAFVSAAVLDREGGLARGFTTYDDSVRVGDRRAFDYEERAASQTMDAVLPRLAELKPPFFLWVHFYDPHAPYVPPEPYASRFPGRPYDGEIAFMDAQLGRLTDALKRKGATVLFVIAGDHGESLGEHGESTHGVFLYQATQHVPLIVSGPGLPTGGTVTANVGLVDVTPTILDLLALPPLAQTDGRSLVALMHGGKPASPNYEMETLYPSLAYGWAALRALVASAFKYIDAPRRELYELPTDPREIHDLAAVKPARVEQLAHALDERAGVMSSGGASDDPATQERRERLASLGYVSGGGAPDGNALDPKDGIRLLPELDAARRALQLGDPNDALPPLERLLAKNPTNIPALLALGQAQLAVGRAALSVATYKQVAAMAPTNALAWFELGNAYAASAPKDDAAFAEAKAAYDHALALSPRHADTYLNYAALLATRRAPDEAMKLLQRARSAGVADPTIETELGVIETARKDMGAARAAFERAIALNPVQAEALEGLGKIAYAGGEFPKAAAYYARALDAHPTASLAKTLGAIRLYELNDRAGARTAFERAVALSSASDPDVADLRALIADLSK